MSNADTLRALIARVESASGPDRELDAEIGRAVGAFDRLLGGFDDSEIAAVTYVPEYDHASILVRMKGRSSGGLRYTEKLSRYTASLDAAVSLVPAGWSILMVWNGKRNICTVHAQPLGTVQSWPDPSEAATPALALVAAALRPGAGGG